MREQQEMQRTAGQERPRDFAVAQHQPEGGQRAGGGNGRRTSQKRDNTGSSKLGGVYLYNYGECEWTMGTIGHPEPRRSMLP